MKEIKEEYNREIGQSKQTYNMENQQLKQTYDREKQQLKEKYDEINQSIMKEHTDLINEKETIERKIAGLDKHFLPSNNPEAPKKKCVICLEKPADHCCVPCGHVIFCEKDAKNFNVGDKCTTCRREIQSIIKVFSYTMICIRKYFYNTLNFSTTCSTFISNIKVQIGRAHV